MGRPLIEIDERQVEALAKIQCTYSEIAAVVGCSEDTLERRFAECIKNGREEGKASLRRLQYKKAMDGNTGMLVWLGKQFLGQRDKQDTELSGPAGGPIEVRTNEIRDRIASRINGIAARIGTEHPTGGDDPGGTDGA